MDDFLRLGSTLGFRISWSCCPTVWIGGSRGYVCMICHSLKLRNQWVGAITVFVQLLLRNVVTEYLDGS